MICAGRPASQRQHASFYLFKSVILDKTKKNDGGRVKASLIGWMTAWLTCGATVPGIDHRITLNKTRFRNHKVAI